MAVDRLYERMGVSDYIMIPANKLSTYSGDKVVLPVSFPFNKWYKEGICGWFSDFIEPVFLGFTCRRSILRESEIDYLHRYEPIGCRDEYTFNILESYGIKAYLNGCMTLTLFDYTNPQVQFRDTVYAIDLTLEHITHLKSRLRNPIRVMSNSVDVNVLDKDPNYIKRYYSELGTNAKVVITSRLHCALPCISMGIPVIILMPQVSYRMSFIERLCPYVLSDKDYRSFDFQKAIDSLVSKDYTLVKAQMVNNAISVISLTMLNKRVFELSDVQKEITEYYSQRDRCEYWIDIYDSAREYINREWNKDDIISYALWGLTDTAEMLFDYINESFPNATLRHVYDSRERKDFHGVISIPYPESPAHDNEYVFITDRKSVV